MDIWIIADTHFGHDNIRRYCKRPFVSVKEMDETIIENWNKVVKPCDTVIHCGDFSFGEPETYRRRLKGNIILCLGNHDRREKVRGFNHVTQIYETKIDGQRIVCCHYAMRTWNCSHHGSWHLWGHSHGSLQDDPCSLSFDVGVDSWNFTPVSYEQIKAKMALKTWTSPIHGRD